jgi:TonB family protein
MAVSFLAAGARFRDELPQAHHYQVVNLVSYEEPVSYAPQPINPRLVAAPKPVLEAMDPPKQEQAALVVAPSVRAIHERKHPDPEVAAPELKVDSKLPVLPNVPPQKVIAVNTFSSGSSAAPTLAKPASSVQTGGFGDVNGIPGSEHQGAPVNIALKGSPDLPKGSGYGNGTGGPRPGVVMSTGFGDGVAVGVPKNGGGTIQQSGFDAHHVAAQSHAIATREVASIPVEITFKPQPDYTDEGRKMKVNGEVQLEVLFSSNGRAHVIKVLQGLGFGLDEQAVKAAEQIKFKPALRAGQPVDSTAVVHIIFELS